MENLDKKYVVELDSISGAIQSSDLLATYLDDEEEVSYQALREEFEPQIEEVYTKVASENPLQLINLEIKLTDPAFEGLYLSKVLGYAALRGDHFKNILLAICNSPNFDVIKTRIGQGVQVAFGLSSGIWITNLIEQVDGKRVKAFLKSQIIPEYRDAAQRKLAHERYARQFSSIHYQSAEFPTTRGELKVLISSLVSFLRHRVEIGANNTSLVPNIKAFLTNRDFQYGNEFVRVIHLFTNYFDISGETKWLSGVFNDARREYAPFNEEYFEFHEEILYSGLEIGAEEDGRVASVLDATIEDDLRDYYELMQLVHKKGYVHDDSIQAIRAFYDRHEGLSIINECLRGAILGHFRRLLVNLPVESYHDFFEMHKIFAVYFQIFNNQKFNQDTKALSLAYVRKLLKTYTDKRGKDYQEIKKFVSQTYLDLGFMKEKQIVELFKTRRKKKTA